MSKEVNRFYVPTLKDNGCWVELRDDSKGGKDWRGYRSLSGVKIVWGHHTVTHPIGDAVKEIDVIKQIHMNQRGWGGIGYNFIITSQEKNGYAIVYQIGDIGSIRAHTPNSKNFRGLGTNTGNVYGIGISVIGMNHLVEPTDAQYRSYHELLKELIYNENVRLPNLKNWDDWQPHWAGDATACYGSKLNRGKVITPPNLSTEEDPVMIKELQKQLETLQAKYDSDMKAINTKLSTLQTKYDTDTKKLTGDLKDINDKLVEDTKVYEDRIKVLSNAIDEDNIAHDNLIKKMNDDFAIERKTLQNTIITLKNKIEDLETEPDPTPEPVVEKSLLEKLLDLLFKVFTKK